MSTAKQRVKSLYKLHLNNIDSIDAFYALLPGFYDTQS